MIEPVRHCDWFSLNAKFRPVARELYKFLIDSHKAGRLQFRFELFESFRSAERQDYLFAKGVSEARAGQSPHNYGLAIDLVPNLTQHEATGLGKPAGWYWPPITDPAWQILQNAATTRGLEVISWDKPHVQLRGWKAHRIRKGLTKAE